MTMRLSQSSLTGTERTRGRGRHGQRAVHVGDGAGRGAAQHRVGRLVARRAGARPAWAPWAPGWWCPWRARRPWPRVAGWPGRRGAGRRRSGSVASALAARGLRPSVVGRACRGRGGFGSRAVGCSGSCVAGAGAVPCRRRAAVPLPPWPSVAVGARGLEVLRPARVHASRIAWYCSYISSTSHSLAPNRRMPEGWCRTGGPAEAAARVGSPLLGMRAMDRDSDFQASPPARQMQTHGTRWGRLSGTVVTRSIPEESHTTRTETTPQTSAVSERRRTALAAGGSSWRRRLPSVPRSGDCERPDRRARPTAGRPATDGADGRPPLVTTATLGTGDRQAAEGQAARKSASRSAKPSTPGSTPRTSASTTRATTSRRRSPASPPAPSPTRTAREADEQRGPPPDDRRGRGQERKVSRRRARRRGHARRAPPPAFALGSRPPATWTTRRSTCGAGCS